MNNPFNFGKVVGGSDFTNRENDIARLHANFSSGINTVLISPRRWGKSSLVLKVATEISKQDQGWRFCFVDLFNVRTEHAFYQLFAREVIRSAATKWEEQIETAKKLFKKITPRFSIGIDDQTDFSIGFDWKEIDRDPSEVLNLPQQISKAKKLKLIVCIDEFQNAAFFNDPLAFQKRLRAHWQHHEAATYCLYGSKRHMMLELFQKQSMPFYKFGDLMLLEKISEVHWIKFIISHFRKTSKSITKELAAVIAQLMENHPYHVQQLASAVWNHTTKTCSKKIVMDALEELAQHLAILFQRDVDTLTNPQLNFLKALANDVSQFSAAAILHEYQLGTSGNVQRIKKALEERELIDLMKPKIEFVDPLFKWWMKNIFMKE